jgi:hypothetical protein
MNRELSPYRPDEFEAPHGGLLQARYDLQRGAVVADLEALLEGPVSFRICHREVPNMEVAADLGKADEVFDVLRALNVGGGLEDLHRDPLADLIEALDVRKDARCSVVRELSAGERNTDESKRERETAYYKYVHIIYNLRKETSVKKRMRE